MIEANDAKEALLDERWHQLSGEEKELFYNTLSQDGLYNVDLEWAVLGIALGKHGAAFVHSRPEIQPEHFYFAAHQSVWEEIIKCCSDGRPLDPVLLLKDLQAHAGFSDMIKASAQTSSAYLGKIINYSQTELHQTRYYVEQLLEYATRRHLLRVLYANFRMTRDLGKYPNTDELVSELLTEVASVTAKSAKHRSYSLSEVSNSIIEDFSNDHIATPTGVARLDEALEGGFYPGKTYCFAARPKIGKTMLMGSLFYNQAVLGLPVSYCAFEMGSKELHYRFLARFMGLNSTDFYRRRKDPAFQAKVIKANEILSASAIANYVNCPNMGLESFKRLLVSKVNKERPNGIYVDYLGKVKGPAYRHNRSEFEEEVADWLHGFAQENDIWVAYACQLNREGNLRGSDGALMGADVVYVLEKDEEVNVAWLKCIASRYTAKINIGTKASSPGLRISSAGPYFYCESDPYQEYSDMERFLQPSLSSELVI